MGPLTKEPPESAKAAQDSAAHSDLAASQGMHTASIDAFGIEIPVRLQGGHTGGALGATDTYQEDTNTLIVFPQGAVLRSSTHLAPGQHLLLKNQKTNQEVPCRVANLRSYSSGYVEIEFIRPAPGFWGIIFPSEASKPPAARVAPAAGPPKQAIVPSKAPAATPVNKGHTPVPRPAPSKAIASGNFPAKVLKPNLSATPATPGVISPRTEAQPAAFAPTTSTTPPSVKEQPIRPARNISFVPNPAPASSFPASSSRKQETLPIADLVAISRPVEKAPVRTSPTAAPTALPSSLGSPEEKEHWATLSYGRFSSFQVLGPEEDTRDNFSLGVPSPVRERNFRRKLIPIGASAAVLALALGTGAFLARRSRRAPVEAASLSLPTTPAPEQPSPVFQPQPTDNPAAESVQIPPQPPPSASVNSNNQPNQSSKQASPEPTAIVASHPKSQTPPASAPTPKPSFKLAPNAAIPQRAPVSRETLPPPAAGDEVAASPGTAGISNSIMPDSLRSDAEVPPPPPEKVAEKTPEKIGGEVKLPQLLHLVQPSYPFAAKQIKLEGEVTVQASVDATGKVVGAKVVSGPVLLQQAAADAVRQWKYAPATLDGKPVPMQVVVKVKFRLN